MESAKPQAKHNLSENCLCNLGGEAMRLPHRALTALSARFAMTKSGMPDESGNYERRHDPKGSHYNSEAGGNSFPQRAQS
jgi:hypothetical protein